MLPRRKPEARPRWKPGALPPSVSSQGQRVAPGPSPGDQWYALTVTAWAPPSLLLGRHRPRQAPPTAPRKTTTNPTAGRRPAGSRKVSSGRVQAPNAVEADPLNSSNQHTAEPLARLSPDKEGYRARPGAAAGTVRPSETPNAGQRQRSIRYEKPGLAWAPQAVVPRGPREGGSWECGCGRATGTPRMWRSGRSRAEMPPQYHHSVPNVPAQ